MLVHVDVGTHLGHRCDPGEEGIRIGGRLGRLLVEERQVRDLIPDEPGLGRCEEIEGIGTGGLQHADQVEPFGAEIVEHVLHRWRG